MIRALSVSFVVAAGLTAAISCSSSDGSSFPEDGGIVKDATSDAGGYITVPMSPPAGRLATTCNAIDAGADSGTCNKDDECGGSIPCDCDSHFCFVDSNCRSDADCAGGERCAYGGTPGFIVSTGHSISNDGWALGYFCTTPQDDCLCMVWTGPGYMASESCAYNLKKQHWACIANP